MKKGKGSVLCRLGVLIKVDAVEEDIEKVENNPNNVAGKKRNVRSNYVVFVFKDFLAAKDEFDSAIPEIKHL